MYLQWFLLPASGVLVMLAAWYGYSSIFEPVNVTIPPPIDPNPRPQSGLDFGEGSCPCQCLVPLTARSRSVMRRLYAQTVQDRADAGAGNEVPDLTKLSKEELKDLLGLPHNADINDQEINGLQELINSGEISLDVIRGVGEELANTHNEVEEEANTGDEVTASTEIMKASDSIPNTDPSEQAMTEKTQPVMNKLEPQFSIGAEEFHSDFDSSVQSQVNNVLPHNVPFAPLTNPFPSRPFPDDYVDLGDDTLTSDVPHGEPTSFIHPVRTFKFRLLLPTFTEIFGFQLASQTIVELYLAKKPGTFERTGIPDAFYERKYWNVLMEVDGNKVINTLPSPGLNDVHGDDPAGEAVSLRRRKGTVDRRDSPGKRSGDTIERIHEKRKTVTRHSRLPPAPLYDGHSSDDIDRWLRRQKLKRRADDSYQDRMSTSRYRQWLHQAINDTHVT